MGRPSGNEQPERLDGSQPLTCAGCMKAQLGNFGGVTAEEHHNVATDAARTAAEALLGRPEPQDIGERPYVPEQERGQWTAAVHRYNRDRSEAFAQFRLAADVAWQAYSRAMMAANDSYDNAVIQASARYDLAMMTHDR